MYERQLDLAPYVSLGPNRWCAMGWPLKRLDVDGAVFFALNHQAGPQFIFLFGTDGSDWRGVPTSPRAPVDAPGHPPALMWFQDGPTEEVLEFGLRRGIHLLKHDYVSLCTDAKIPVTILPGEKGLTLRAYATALVNWVFRKESIETRQCILFGLVGKAKKGVGTAKGQRVLDALQHIAPEDAGRRVVVPIHVRRYLWGARLAPTPRPHRPLRETLEDALGIFSETPTNLRTNSRTCPATVFPNVGCALGVGRAGQITRCSGLGHKLRRSPPTRRPYPFWGSLCRLVCTPLDTMAWWMGPDNTHPGGKCVYRS